MLNDKSMEILKEAILLERKGHAFYQKVADHARNNTVREFFQIMADEELQHIKVLEGQYKAFQKNARFDELEAPSGIEPSIANLVLSDELKAKIAAAGFEAAAISAAMFMEEQAIELYGERARRGEDPRERALYRWLADWEHGHLVFLSRLDREIKASIWEDNRFWPM
jgi:rubrerythrin